MAREVKVMIRMAEERKDELQEFAEIYGVSMSALGALIIGQWLHSQKRVVTPIVEQMSSIVGDALKG